MEQICNFTTNRRTKALDVINDLQHDTFENV